VARSGPHPAAGLVGRAAGLAENPPLEKIFIGFAGTNPNLRPATAPFGEDDYGMLGIGSSGIPFIHAERRASRPAEVPPVQIHTVAPGWAMVDGELVVVDRNAPDTWNREIRRSGITPNTGVQRANAAAGAVDLANQALEGINLAQMSEDYGTSAYQVVFEANEDGRRRAVLRTYQVRVDQSTGDYLINPSHVYVGEDGGPAFDNILYRQGAEIRPADQPYAVVQYEDEKLGD
jgi:hypothetical protein